MQQQIVPQNLAEACLCLQASLQGPVANSTVAAAAAADGGCQLAPLVADAGAYNLSVNLGTANIAGSPFQLQVSCLRHAS